MLKVLGAFGAALSLAICATPAAAQEWTPFKITGLYRSVTAASNEGLPRLSTDALVAAISTSDPEAIDAAANDLALRLARMHLLGAAGQSERRGWHIVDTDARLPLEEMLATAVRQNRLSIFYAGLRPKAREYALLRSAYAAETDPERRETIARNMERWRWLPRDLGDTYVFVNAARFEADLYREGEHVGTWRVIVGTTRTPTPVFQATIEGVVLNPWWEVPASIARESVAALVRNNPATARARGYVYENGRYRQRPGPNNALGQMKLVMPNPYSVYMHDTPNRDLFDREVRSFSHGCIRTGDAIGYATTLLEGVATREEVDAILATGQTRTLSIAEPMPVYITYFTAVSDGMGGVAILDDIYNRDRNIRVSARGGQGGPAARAALAAWPLLDSASASPQNPDGDCGS
ncbi:L,D-transpeptidase family protein [Aurantiacibacter gilvus]|uniref:L,D-transpeptidase family protein n=1 Tax=Aurantiacibacter gilvus TaxID=3139141 RepID=A0ABU9IA26_9SPHN